MNLTEINDNIQQYSYNKVGNPNGLIFNIGSRTCIGKRVLQSANYRRQERHCPKIAKAPSLGQEGTFSVHLRRKCVFWHFQDIFGVKTHSKIGYQQRALLNLQWLPLISKKHFTNSESPIYYVIVQIHICSKILCIDQLHRT